MPYRNKHYTEFQMIAFETFTALVIDDPQDSRYRGFFGQLPEFRDLRASIRRDLIKRIKHLWTAIELAMTHPQTSDNPNVLKIFMVPEFYFRSTHPLGNSYSANSFLELLDFLKKRAFAHHSLSHWLFVIGTIVHRVADLTGSTNAEPAGAEGVYNSVVVVKGGAGALSDDNPFYWFSKQFASGLDDIHDGYGLVEGKDIFGRPYHLRLIHGRENPQTMLRNFMTIDGINLGIEICLDICYDKSQGWLRSLITNNPAKDNVQLHLLTACGMPLDDILPQSIVAITGGYFLRVDGAAPDSSLHKVINQQGRLTQVKRRVPPGHFYPLQLECLNVHASGVRPTIVRVYAPEQIP